MGGSTPLEPTTNQAQNKFLKPKKFVLFFLTFFLFFALLKTLLVLITENVGYKNFSKEKSPFDFYYVITMSFYCITS